VHKDRVMEAYMGCKGTVPSIWHPMLKLHAPGIFQGEKASSTHYS
jgi:hypothetical protein